MRKLMILCLLATVATPALSRPRDSDARRPGAPEQSGRSTSGGYAGESRASRPERPQVSFDRETRSQWRGNAETSTERQPRVRPAEPPVARAWGGMGSDNDRSVPPGRNSIPDSSTVENWRPRERRANDDVRLSRDGLGAPDERWERVRERRALERQVRNPADAQVDEARRERWVRDRRDSRPFDGRWNERTRESLTPRPGTQPPLRYTAADRNSPRTHWRSDWRNDHRYDWRRHRDRHRSAFHIGVYYDPFGWNYQRYSVGWRLWPDYYSSRYWLDDPWQYRLPPAYPGTRWIRYHNDALLVDTWTGEVVDVVYNFFW